MTTPPKGDTQCQVGDYGDEKGQGFLTERDERAYK